MRVDIPFLILALALLWIPRSWFRRGPIRHSHRKHQLSARPAQDGASLAPKREFAKTRNYYDFFRAAAGTFALFGGWGVQPVIAPPPGAPLGEYQRLLGLKLVVVFAAVLIQTLRGERRRFSLAAPVFFIAGACLGMQVPLAAACAFIIAWLFTPVAPHAQGFLVIFAVAVGGLGAVFHGIGVHPAAAAALGFLPVLLSLLSRRPLVVFSRRGSLSPRDSRS